MATINININGRSIECAEGMSILEAADSAGIYIPRLCYHPDLPPTGEVIWTDSVFQGDAKIPGEDSGGKAGEKAHCNLCLVEIEGYTEPVNSCVTTAEDAMVVFTETPQVILCRKKALSKILADHPHACLTCAQKQGCSRTDCSSNVPLDERCCILLGRCQLEKISDYIGIPGNTPKYVPPNRPILKDDPLFDRDFNLCIGCLRCVRVCKDVRGVDVLGAVWKENRAWIGTLRAAGLKEADCRFCGACVEICPTGTLLDKENVAPVRKDSPVPCVGKCPAGIDIPRYLRLIATGQNKEALELIQSSVPFPGILGYVCFHPCEDVCRRGEIDESVAICALKRYVADSIPTDDYLRIQAKQDTGKKIAIIGSGP
ncbi:MAG: 2Fe-2S iron-sulfur cluster-binding protein, partial [candidate division Zixibacteria bacterium]